MDWLGQSHADKRLDKQEFGLRPELVIPAAIYRTWPIQRLARVQARRISGQYFGCNKLRIGLRLRSKSRIDNQHRRLGRDLLLALRPEIHQKRRSKLGMAELRERQQARRYRGRGDRLRAFG